MEVTINYPIPEDLQPLYKLAQGASHGEWCSNYCYSAIRHVSRNCDMECYHEGEEECVSFGRYDGPYIAAANPDKVSSLIERIAKLEAQVKESEEL